MNSDETTPLVSSLTKPIRTDEDLEAAHPRLRTNVHRNTTLPSVSVANKALIVATATLAILLFVIIIDMSITALQISVPAFKKPD